MSGVIPTLIVGGYLGAEKLKDARVWGTVLGGQIFPAQVA